MICFWLRLSWSIGTAAAATLWMMMFFVPTGSAFSSLKSLTTYSSLASSRSLPSSSAGYAIVVGCYHGTRPTHNFSRGHLWQQRLSPCSLQLSRLTLRGSASESQTKEAKESLKESAKDSSKESPQVSTRAQRKAKERAKKGRVKKQRQGRSSNNHRNPNQLSNHPEAILKRQRQQQQKQQRRTQSLKSVEANSGKRRWTDLTVEGSTADDVVKAIKRAQNSRDSNGIREIAAFLLDSVDETFGYGYRGSLLSRLAVAALHLEKPDSSAMYEIAQRALQERRIYHRPSMLPLESAAVVRGLLRCHRTDSAWEVLEDELSLPLDGWIDWSTCDNDTKERVIHRARAIGSIVSRHFYEGEPTAALHALHKLREMGPLVTREAGLASEEVNMPWERIVRGAAQCETWRREGRWDAASQQEDPALWPCNFVYSVLDAMVSFPSDNNDKTFEALCNALVRRTVFLTGAVDMAGCPDPDRGEVAFIGRSNVGKSSLVNMLTNRKSLAFTSKTPGKTQQFNYFAINDKHDLERQIRYGDDVPGTKDRDSFYMVDLPGFGYAKVPQSQRQRWANFMQEYLQHRTNLRVLFHLIDSRHGPTDEDARIMSNVGAILPTQTVKYVIILTKADKVKGKNNSTISTQIKDKLIQTMKNNKVGFAPIVLTSAETRLGRDEVWKYLRLAAELTI